LIIPLIILPDIISASISQQCRPDLRLVSSQMCRIILVMARSLTITGVPAGEPRWHLKNLHLAL
jgi:hypothetical protein